jgi:hypothetical protein
VPISATPSRASQATAASAAVAWWRVPAREHDGPGRQHGGGRGQRPHAGDPAAGQDEDRVEQRRSQGRAARRRAGRRSPGPSVRAVPAVAATTQPTTAGRGRMPSRTAPARRPRPGRSTAAACRAPRDPVQARGRSTATCRRSRRRRGRTAPAAGAPAAAPARAPGPGQQHGRGDREADGQHAHRLRAVRVDDPGQDRHGAEAAGAQDREQQAQRPAPLVGRPGRDHRPTLVRRGVRSRPGRGPYPARMARGRHRRRTGVLWTLSRLWRREPKLPVRSEVELLHAEVLQLRTLAELSAETTSRALSAPPGGGRTRWAPRERRRAEQRLASCRTSWPGCAGPVRRERGPVGRSPRAVPVATGRRSPSRAVVDRPAAGRAPARAGPSGS